MTDKVNELYEVLAKAKDLARELYIDNSNNFFHLNCRTNDAVNEWRPLTWEERIDEAKKYKALFQKVSDSLDNAENQIANNY